MCARVLVCEQVHVVRGHAHTRNDLRVCTSLLKSLCPSVGPGGLSLTACRYNDLVRALSTSSCMSLHEDT